ncbi:hypothetical protein [Phenylobacterium sp.]|uniref:hypothetical protein n=1 Tax=Phenylobacterium sp. TaxID=1871053 RepID=UPI003BA8BD50
MAINGKPAALERGGLSDIVRNDAERPEDKAIKQAKKALVRRAIAPCSDTGATLAERCLSVIRDQGTASASDVAASLKRHGINRYKPVTIRARLNGLRKKGLIRFSDHGRGGEDARQWEIVPNPKWAQGAPCTSDNGPVGELRFELAGGHFDMRVYRMCPATEVMTPTKDGLRLNVEHLPGVIAELQAVEVHARKKGWIGGDE